MRKWAFKRDSFFSKSARQLLPFLSLPQPLFSLSLPPTPHPPPHPPKKTGSSSPSSSAASSFSAHAFSAPHPRTGKDVQYILHRSNSKREEKKDDDEDDKCGGSDKNRASSSSVVSLLEASRFAPSHGSWLLEPGRGEEGAVCSDPGILLLAEVDPLFVALPALSSARALRSGERRRVEGGEEQEDAAAVAAGECSDVGRFVDAEAAVCGGERGEDSGKRAAAALALLVALAGGREDGGEKEKDAAMPAPSSSPDCCSPLPLSPPSPRSRARSSLLRAAGEALAPVCEVRTVGGDSYFRLCERRTEAWLRLKARAAAAALKQTGGPAFAGLEGEALEAAGGALVAEWLPREWSERMGWPCPGAGSSSRPGSAPAANSRQDPVPSWAPESEKAAGGPFTRDPNLPSETESLMQREERYQQAGDFAKKMKLDAAAAAREKAKAVRQDARALAAKKEASTMKSLAGFFVVKKKQ